MFQFSPLAPRCLWIQQRVTRHDSRRVSPFGHPRINAYVRLPEAFRSLSRPSSPVRAKASTVRPCSLDRISATPPKETWSIPGPPIPRTTRVGALAPLSRRLPTQHPIPTTHVVKQPGRGISKSPRSQIIYMPVTRLSTGRKCLSIRHLYDDLTQSRGDAEEAVASPLRFRGSA